jgi:hypothetical protein
MSSTRDLTPADGSGMISKLLNHDLAMSKSFIAIAISGLRLWVRKSTDSVNVSVSGVMSDRFSGHFFCIDQLQSDLRIRRGIIDPAFHNDFIDRLFAGFPQSSARCAYAPRSLVPKSTQQSAHPG